MQHLFFGGTHPTPCKELSGADTAPALQPDLVVIPMRQHIGSPCRPLVAVGDVVGVGQKIGDGEGLCVPVHASVSGTVIAVEPRHHGSGSDVLSVVIRNDYRDTPNSALTEHQDFRALSAEEILRICREAGVVGMGGATFPTHVKASAAPGGVDTLIANACECEPYLTADDVLLRSHTEKVLQGLEILRHVLRPRRTVIAIEDNKPEALAALRKALPHYPEMVCKVLPTRYPQGAEKQLIQAVTLRQVPAGKLPGDVGCAVFNVSTCAAVYRAVCLGMPVTKRIVTVTGEAVRRPQNFSVRIGTPIEQVIAAAGGLTEDVWKVVMGGPMMGLAQCDLSAPVIKGSNGVLCLSQEQNREAADPLCIRCGKCVSACPMHLQPLYLYHYERSGEHTELERLHLNDCIECGCCAYVCPGRLPLVERFRGGKRALKEANAQ